MIRSTLVLSLLGVALSGAQAGTLLFDQNVTGNVIFGSGNGNGGFTVDSSGPVELALRAKQRFPEANVFNSNGAGGYNFASGSAGAPAGNAIWNFEWSINTDASSTSGKKIGNYTYKLGFDSDPSQGTSYQVFDPIKPPPGGGFWDHSFGDNSTGNGQGIEASSLPQYEDLVVDYNLVQQSWRPSWFLTNFNPNANASYNFYLAAYSLEGALVGRTDIQVIIGDGGAAVIPEPASLALIGIALAALGVTHRRKN